MVGFLRPSQPQMAVGSGVATNTAMGFTDDAVGSAFQGMRSGGGHAMPYLVDEGLIPNTGSLASCSAMFEDLDIADPDQSC